MKDSEFKKGIKEIKKIKLNPEDKNAILNSILNVPVVSPFAPRKSEWVKNPKQVSRLWAALFVLSTVISVMGYNSENSLPGDPLYGVKVNFTEPLRTVLNLTPADKAEWENAKAIRRLDEAAQLALQRKLNPKYRADLVSLFNQHVDSFNSSVSVLPPTAKNANLIKSEFQASVSARVQMLESLSNELKQSPEQSEGATSTLNLQSTSTSTTTPTTTPTAPGTFSTTSTTSRATSSATSTASSSASTTATSTSGNNTDQNDEENQVELKKLEDMVSKKLQQSKQSEKVHNSK